MDNHPHSNPKNDQEGKYWAQTVSRLQVSEIPSGATNLNVDGNLVASPLQGFGQLWKKTFRVRLTGSNLTPAEVMKIWKEAFVKLQPEFNRFYPSMSGVVPGELMFIDSTVPILPNSRGILPISTGVLVLYADDTMFTVITPEGHPESGWNTFSTVEEDGIVVAQIEALTRATDPIYEFGFRFMGGTQMQDRVWTHVLRSLAKTLDVQAEVEMEKVCVDASLQWKAARNLWKNAIFRTMFYKIGAPVRWVRGRFHAKMG